MLVHNKTFPVIGSHNAKNVNDICKMVDLPILA